MADRRWPDGHDQPSDYWISNLPADTEPERLARLARLRRMIELDYKQLDEASRGGHGTDGAGLPPLEADEAGLALAAPPAPHDRQPGRVRRVPSGGWPSHANATPPRGSWPSSPASGSGTRCRRGCGSSPRGSSIARFSCCSRTSPRRSAGAPAPWPTSWRRCGRCLPTRCGCRRRIAAIRTPSWSGSSPRCPGIREALLRDAQAICDGDPAAHVGRRGHPRYPGFFATASTGSPRAARGARSPWSRGCSPRTPTATPGSTSIRRRGSAASFAIDHGTGIVIGETAVLGDRVKLYQGVTLGALSVDKAIAGRPSGIRRSATTS